MATVEDSDGDVINVGWTWHALDTADDGIVIDADAANAIEQSEVSVLHPGSW